MRLEKVLFSSLLMELATGDEVTRLQFIDSICTIRR